MAVLPPFRRRLLVSAFAVGLLNACVTHPPASLAVAAAPKPGHGTVIVHASIQGLKYLNNFHLLARPLAGGEAVSLQTWGPSSSGYWSAYYDESPKGGLIAIALPKGDYEFFSFSAMSGAWGGLRAVKANKPFSRKFRVLEGEATYVGQFSLRIKGDKGTLPSAGSATQLDFDTVVLDGSAQDLQDVGQLVQGLKPDQVKVRLAQ